ncbi:MAG: exodeoxyribonuclease V subunit gamma [Acidobacteria bacterium]|nr:exodeoxyribonuclease V subunit gamma [Acidobacteriota bacterium]MDW7983349.1 PD-(D/E)XK nuclease family protein [Acidobacteriota bacterium]
MALETVYVGGFYPELEERLLAWLRERRAEPDGPWRTLWVVVPSGSLQLYLKQQTVRRLTDVERLGLQVLSLPQLYRLLTERLTGFQSDPGEGVRAFLIEQVLQGAARAGGPLRLFHRLAESYTVGVSLLQAIQELKEAGFSLEEVTAWQADPELVSDPITQTRLQDLCHVWTLYEQALARFGWQDPIDSVQKALQVLAEMDTGRARDRLNLPEYIAFYGFFSFTGLSSRLVEAIAAHARVTLFFAVPLVPRPGGWAFHPAFEYVRSAFEATFYGRAQRVVPLSPRPDTHLRFRTARLFVDGAEEITTAPFLRPSGAEPQEDRGQTGRVPTPAAPSVLREPLYVYLWSCSDRLHEMEHVAGRVLHHLRQGVPPSEVAVVVRSWNEEAPVLLDVLERFHVPFNIVRALPARSHPVVQWLQNLVDGFRSDWFRVHLLGVLRHPLFRLDRLGVDDPREVALWQALAERWGITRGSADWETLWRAFRGGPEPRPPVPGPRSSDDEGPRLYPPTFHGVRMTLEQCERFRRAIQQFFDVVRQVPPRATWRAYADWFLAFLEAWTRVEAAQADDEGRQLWERFRRYLQDLAHLDEADGRPETGGPGAGPPSSVPGPWEIPVDRFYRALAYALARTTRPLPPFRPDGVWVLDVLALRGLSFQWVLALGLEEGQFPQKIQEDPFLPEDLRRSLRNVNPWLSIPQEQYHEDRALFYGLVQSARKGLELSWARTRHSGQPCLRSQFLNDLERLLRPVLPLEERRVPRNPRLRLDEWVRQRAWTMVHPIDFQTWYAPPPPRLTGRPGRVETPSPYVTAWLTERGISPSLCVEYLRCPSRTLWKQFFQLDEPPFPYIQFQPAPAAEGTFVHRFLQHAFQEILQRRPKTPKALMGLLRKWFERFERAWRQTQPVGLPRFWEWRRSYIRTSLLAFIESEIQEWLTSDADVWLEHTVEFPWDSPDVPHPVRIRGRMDRVRFVMNDRKPTTEDQSPGLIVEVADYKWSRKFHDLNLNARWSESTLHQRSGEQGYEYLFQLAFYVWMLAHGRSLPVASHPPSAITARLVWLPAAGPVRTLLSWIRDYADRWRLTPDAAARLAEDVETLVRAVVQGISTGRFEVRPGPPCRLCQFDQICRYRDEHP